MTEHTANGESTSFSKSKEVDSPLTVCDLIDVLDSLFGGEISELVIGAARSNAALKSKLAAPVSVATTAALKSKITAAPVSVATTTALKSNAPIPVSDDLGICNGAPEDASPGGDTAIQAVSSAHVTRWYGVTVGREVGVFADWSLVAPLVVGVSGACYTRHSSRPAADEAFQHAAENHAVRRVV